MKAKPRRAKPKVQAGKRPAKTRRTTSDQHSARRQAGPSKADTASGDEQPMTSPKRLLRAGLRSEEHTSELQSRLHLVCRLLLEKKKKKYTSIHLTKKTIKTFKHT